MKSLNRRKFIEQSSLGLGVAMTAGSELLGVTPSALKTRQLKAGEKFGIGIIGCGNRSKSHIASIQKVEGVEIRALCDLLPQAIDGRRADIQGYNPKAYRFYQDLVEDKNLDGVVIATPNDTHKAPTIAALEAGKHVLCEKPMALTSAIGLPEAHPWKWLAWVDSTTQNFCRVKPRTTLD